MEKEWWASAGTAARANAATRTERNASFICGLLSIEPSHGTNLRWVFSRFLQPVTRPRFMGFFARSARNGVLRFPRHANHSAAARPRDCRAGVGPAYGPGAIESA